MLPPFMRFSRDIRSDALPMLKQSADELDKTSAKLS